jgi:class 3 adenylate cyclase
MFESTTVFASTICNYADIASQVSTRDLLHILASLCSNYDHLARKRKIRQVESVGDIYIGVAGAPERTKDHAVQAAYFALDALEMVKQFKVKVKTKTSGTPCDTINVRIGMSSGIVTAGLIGEDNPHWVVVGDTVKKAFEMMESFSKPMSITISESMYLLLQQAAQGEPSFKFTKISAAGEKPGSVVQGYLLSGRN